MPSRSFEIKRNILHNIQLFEIYYFFQSGKHGGIHSSSSKFAIFGIFGSNGFYRQRQIKVKFFTLSQTIIKMYDYVQTY